MGARHAAQEPVEHPRLAAASLEIAQERHPLVLIATLEDALEGLEPQLLVLDLLDHAPARVEAELGSECAAEPREPGVERQHLHPRQGVDGGLEDLLAGLELEVGPVELCAQLVESLAALGSSGQALEDPRLDLPCGLAREGGGQHLVRPGPAQQELREAQRELERLARASGREDDLDAVHASSSCSARSRP